jgi:hypothetical protein
MTLYKKPDSDKWVDKKEYFDFLFSKDYMFNNGTLKDYFKELK